MFNTHRKPPFGSKEMFFEVETEIITAKKCYWWTD